MSQYINDILPPVWLIFTHSADLYPFIEKKNSYWVKYTLLRRVHVHMNCCIEHFLNVNLAM